MEATEILGILSVPAITVICYLVGEFVKVFEKIPDKVIPTICGITGAALGVVGMYTMPEFPATDILGALAVGIVSGLAATGAHQLGHQLKKGKTE